MDAKHTLLVHQLLIHVPMNQVYIGKCFKECFPQYYFLVVSLYIHGDGSGFGHEMGWDSTKEFCENQGQRLCDISEVCEQLGGPSILQDQICIGKS